MPQPVVLTFALETNFYAVAAVRPHKKRITISHPAIVTWAQPGQALRISVRRTSARDVDAVSHGLIIETLAPAFISGPFFDGTNGK
jgi:hypothetical protein